MLELHIYIKSLTSCYYDSHPAVPVFPVQSQSHDNEIKFHPVRNPAGLPKSP